MTDRRQVLQMGALAAVGLAGIAACSDDDPQGDAPTPATPDAQQAEELALIAAYDAAIATAGQSQVVALQRIRDEHAAHLRALGWQDPAPPAPSATSVSRRALRRAETAAGRSHAGAAVSETDPDRAELLALISASEAQHVVELAAL